MLEAAIKGKAALIDFIRQDQNLMRDESNRRRVSYLQKKIIFTGLLALMTPVAYSAGIANIIEGTEIENCWCNQPDRGKASTCLHEQFDKSNEDMDALISKTVEQIKENNSGPVFKSTVPDLTIGDVYSKHFLEAQKAWKDYREKLCLAVGSQIGEDAYDYWPYIYQCQINLNKRHAEEIKMLRADEQ